MKRFVLFVALFALLCTGIFAQESIAVFPFEDLDKVLKQNEAIMFYREFSNEFTNKNAGKFKIVPRQEVEKLINTEAAFQLSDFSAKAKTTEMQRVLNGTQILSGVIGKVNNNIRITVSLYTYPDLAQLPGGTTLSVSNTTELFNKIPELVKNMQNETNGKNKIYKVGDRGPAGGIIFYDRGFVADGWRYLEAAPAETDFHAEWGAYMQNVAGTSTATGSGKRNTQLIIERFSRLGENNRAAQICAAMDINGFKDWFLPSKDELDLMYKNLKVKGLGSFEYNSYWSSSQNSDSGAWDQRFYDGNQGSVSKNATYSVRAIRAF